MRSVRRSDRTRSTALRMTLSVAASEPSYEVALVLVGIPVDRTVEWRCPGSEDLWIAENYHGRIRRLIEDGVVDADKVGDRIRFSILSLGIREVLVAVGWKGAEGRRTALNARQRVLMGADTLRIAPSISRPLRPWLRRLYIARSCFAKNRPHKGIQRLAARQKGPKPKFPAMRARASLPNPRRAQEAPCRRQRTQRKPPALGPQPQRERQPLLVRRYQTRCHSS